MSVSALVLLGLDRASATAELNGIGDMKSGPIGNE